MLRAESGGSLLCDLFGGLAVELLQQHVSGVRLLCDCLQQVSLAVFHTLLDPEP